MQILWRPEREEDSVSNAQRKGKRDSSKLYKERGRREENKARRIARDKARAKPMSCGHGSRWGKDLGFGTFCRKCGKPA